MRERKIRVRLGDSVELDTSTATWSVEVRETGVDWVTVTTSNPQAALSLEDWTEQIFEEQSQRGAMIRPWAAQGYRGRATEGIEFGGRPDGWICRIHGPLAHARWHQLARLGAPATRIDVQVTATLADGPVALAEMLYGRLDRANAERRPPLALALTRFAGGGSMLCIGRRSSERYLRLYEKSLEEPGVWPDHTWRWECEYKSVAAQNVVHALATTDFSGTAAIGIVYSEFLRHGVACPFLEPSQFPFEGPPIE